MKSHCLFGVLALFAAGHLTAQRPTDTLASGKETPVPREWKVPAGTAPSIRLDKDHVPVLDTALYFHWMSYAGYESMEQRFPRPTKDSPEVCKIAVKFLKDASWAAPLRENELRIEDAQFLAVVSQYHLHLESYYEADEQFDGLIFSVGSNEVNIFDACRDLSGLSKVNWVSLYTPR